jgi:soluble lytic murein transglycosylase-like protein
LRVAFFVLAVRLVSLGGEIAVLRNGFSIQHDRREQRGDVTRLFIADGYLDVPTDQIASFEVDETPPPQPATVQQPPQKHTQTPPSGTHATRVNLDEVVRQASARRQLDPDFVNSVIKAESNFYPHAVSRKGAQGLMQLMPQTAAKLGVSDPFDPKANVEAGTAYLSQLLDLYNDDAITALAAYNAGPQRVQQYHGVPPYRETRLYIARIVRDFNAKKARQKAATTRALEQEKKKTGNNGVGRKTAVRNTASNAKEQQVSASSSQPSAEAK